jgi:hypothetical protein
MSSSLEDNENLRNWALSFNDGDAGDLQSPHQPTSCYCDSHLLHIVVASDFVFLSSLFVQCWLLAHKLDHSDSWDPRWTFTFLPIWICTLITTILLVCIVYVSVVHFQNNRSKRGVRLDSLVPSGVEVIPVIGLQFSKLILLVSLSLFAYFVKFYLTAGRVSLIFVISPLFFPQAIGLMYSVLIIDYSLVVGCVCISAFAFELLMILREEAILVISMSEVMIPVLLLGVLLFISCSLQFHSFLRLKLRRRRFSNFINLSIQKLFLLCIASFFFLLFVVLLFAIELNVGLENIQNFSMIFLSLEFSLVVLGLYVLSDATTANLRQRQLFKLGQSSSMKSVFLVRASQADEEVDVES